MVSETAMEEIGPTPSCSHHSSSKEIEYDYKREEGKDPGVDTTTDTSDEEAAALRMRDVKFKPSTSSPLIIELGDREVLFAIAVFLLVSVALGLVLFIGTWKSPSSEDEVSRFMVLWYSTTPYFTATPLNGQLIVKERIHCN